MSDLNRACISGRFGKDPELRYTTSGTAVVNFDLAVDGRKTGDSKETYWIACVAWKQTAEFINQYCRKGTKLIVDGRLQVRSWEAQDGSTRKQTEIVVDNATIASQAGESNGGGGQSHQNQGARAPGPRQQQPPGPRGGYQQGAGRQQSGRQVAQETYGGGGYGGGYQQDDLGMDDVPF